MKTQKLNILIFLVFLMPFLAQAQVLRGIITGDDGSVPKSTKVFILGVGESDIDANGAYSISLSSCTGCDVGAVISVNVNSDYGSAREDFTIPKNLSMSSFNITVPRNNMIVITGTVKDRSSGRYISGIKVTPVIPNSSLNVPSVNTNSTGIFRFVISKRGVGSSQTIHLIFTDPVNGNYLDFEKIAYTNQYAPLTIELDKCKTCGIDRDTIKVDGYEKTSVFVKAGEIVELKASGSIKVGSFVGNSHPEGKAEGVFNLSLGDYNIIRKFNHAALMYRFDKNEPWKAYDPNSKNSYVPQKDGFLEVEVNDNKQSDNSGYYTVEISVKH